MKTKANYIRYFALVAVFLPIAVFGKVRLPTLVGNGMVLQRDATVKIWGWAAEGEHVTVSFNDSTYKTAAGNNGRWRVMLHNLKAGGPYSMTIRGSNTITLTDILVGDVWVSSGQSNMEHTMYSVRERYDNEIENARNNDIRYFDVPQDYDFNAPRNQLKSGKWMKTNPQNVGSFSAVAYFFAKELYQKYQVPIGIINASVGGSPAESWISEDALKHSFPDYYKEEQRFKDSSLVKKIEHRDQTRMQSWYNQLRKKDHGFQNPQNPWYTSDLSVQDWASMKIPGYWADTHLGDVNGVVWFSKTITVPSAMVGKQAALRLGRIVDADSVYINGQFVGTTGYQYPRRRYKIPSGVLKKGKNTITVRIINVSGRGGFVPDKPYDLSAGGHTINLKGAWKYRLGVSMKSLQPQTFIRWKPVGLYNAMIAPLFNYHIKGVIWYQGESNTDRPVEYQDLFSTLIRNWRDKWDEGDFPFLYVQLPNFMKAKNQPGQSNWALLRDSQRKTLSVPHTGMAVAIDIGEWNDIHPLDKKDVGKRLALVAQKVAYGDENVVYSGPLYQSMNIRDNKIILTFNDVGSGLVAKDAKKLGGFSIAGRDHHFVWAKAKIENNKVIVWSDKISDPVAVRYAWADNPENANLYNREGLPASSFRTDDWAQN